MKVQKNYGFKRLLTREHEGKWVALSSSQDQVLDFSASFTELKNRLGTTWVVYLKAPKKGLAYAF